MKKWMTNAGFLILSLVMQPIFAVGAHPENHSSRQETPEKDPKPGTDAKTCTLTGKIETRGVSLEGVSLVLYLEKQSKAGAEQLIEVARTKPNDRGEFSFRGQQKKMVMESPSLRFLRYTIYCYDKNQEFIGGANTFANFQNSDSFRIPFPVVLMEFESRNLTLVDQNKVPLNDRKVDTIDFAIEPFAELLAARSQNRYSRSLALKGEFGRTTQSDAEGKVTIRIPKNGSTRVRISNDSDSHFEVDVSSNASQIVLNRSTKIAGSVICNDSKLNRKDVELSLFINNDTEPNKNYFRRFRVKTRPTTNGEFRIEDAMPGRYQIRVRCDDPKYYSPQQLDIDAEANQTVLLKPIKFENGTPVRGRVVDKQTGKGVPNMSVGVSRVRSGAAIRWSVSLQTDESGYYTAYCPPGKIRVYFSLPPNNKYRQPSQAELAAFASFDVAAGESDKRFPDFTVTKGVKLKGFVKDLSGKRISGVGLSVYDTSSLSVFNTMKSNAAGEFVLENVDADELISIRARSSATGATSNGALVIDPNSYLKKPIEVTISKDFAAYATAVVVDTNDRPIPSAKINLSENKNFVSKSGQRMGIGSTLQQFGKISVDGKLQTYPLQPGDSYSLIIQADGYNDYQGKQFVAEKGKTLDLGKVVLKRSNLVLSGVVKGTDGKPVDDAKLFGAGDSKLLISGRSNASGEFNLNGWPESNAYLFVQKDGYQFQGHLIRDAGKTPEIELRRLDEPAYRKIAETPFDKKKRLELCKRMLMRLYELPAEKRAKINFVILLNMAKADPAQAMKWAALPENAKYRDLVTANVAEAIVESDPDEAIAMFAENKSSRAGYHIFTAASREDLPMDVRRKLAAIFQKHIAWTKDSSKVYKTAQLANLLYRFGDGGAGKTLANEAFMLAENLSGLDREAYVIGVTAEYLSVFDLVRAKNLLGKMKETRGTTPSRHLGGIAYQIAADQPDTAIQIIENIIPGYSPRVVHEIAKSDVKKAFDVVDRLFERGEIIDGCDSMLAALLGGKQHLDSKEIASRVNRLFDIYMSHRREFRTYMNYGYESGFAGYTAYTAKRLKLDNPAMFVMKALASRRSKTEFGGNVSLSQASVTMARYLALVDRSACRFLLEKIEAQQEILGGGGSASVNKGDYLVAWALTDTEKALQVFEQMLKEELGKHDVLPQSRITSVFRVLCHNNDDSLLAEMTRNGIWYPGKEQ